MKKLLAIVLTILTILSALAVMPVSSVAADSYKYPVINTNVKVKGKENANGRITFNDNYTKLYATPKGQKTVTITSQSSITGAVLRGKTVFYTFVNGKYNYFAQCSVNGTGKKNIYKRQVASGETYSLRAITGNTAIIYRSTKSSGSVIYKYDIAKKKFTNLSGKGMSIEGNRVEAFCGRIYYRTTINNTLNIVVISSGKKSTYKDMELGLFTDEYRFYRNGKKMYRVDRNYTFKSIKCPQEFDYYMVNGDTFNYCQYNSYQDHYQFYKNTGEDACTFLGVDNELGYSNEKTGLYLTLPSQIINHKDKSYAIIAGYDDPSISDTSKISYLVYRTDDNMALTIKVAELTSFIHKEGRFMGYEVVGSTLYTKFNAFGKIYIKSTVLK